MPRKSRKPDIRHLVMMDDDTREWLLESQTPLYLKNGYPCLYHDGAEAYLHRHIMGNPYKLDVHHANANTLDCRRSNLIVLTRRDHRQCHRHQIEKNIVAMRQAVPRSKSGFKGVYWRASTGHFDALLKYDGRIQTLGTAHSPEEAALLYDAAVLAFIATPAYTNLVPVTPWHHFLAEAHRLWQTVECHDLEHSLANMTT